MWESAAISLRITAGCRLEALEPPFASLWEAGLKLKKKPIQIQDKAPFTV
jgi:hypothetical protein